MAQVVSLCFEKYFFMERKLAILDINITVEKCDSDGMAFLRLLVVEPGSESRTHNSQVIFTDFVCYSIPLDMIV